MNDNKNLFPPHLSVVHVIQAWNKDNKCLLIRRCSNSMTGNWQMVSGKINDGETAVQAAKRELKEETGLVSNRIYSADYVEIFYEQSKNSIYFAPVFVAFIDTEQDVSLSPEEHDSYEWVSFDKALDTLEFRGQREALKHIIENFINKTPNKIFLI